MYLCFWFLDDVYAIGGGKWNHAHWEQFSSDLNFWAIVQIVHISVFLFSVGWRLSKLCTVPKRSTSDMKLTDRSGSGFHIDTLIINTYNAHNFSINANLFCLDSSYNMIFCCVFRFQWIFPE